MKTKIYVLLLLSLCFLSQYESMNLIRVIKGGGYTGFICVFKELGKQKSYGDQLTSCKYIKNCEALDKSLKPVKSNGKNGLELICDIACGFKLNKFFIQSDKENQVGVKFVTLKWNKNQIINALDGNVDVQLNNIHLVNNSDIMVTFESQFLKVESIKTSTDRLKFHVEKIGDYMKKKAIFSKVYLQYGSGLCKKKIVIGTLKLNLKISQKDKQICKFKIKKLTREIEQKMNKHIKNMNVSHQNEIQSIINSHKDNKNYNITQFQRDCDLRINKSIATITTNFTNKYDKLLNKYKTKNISCKEIESIDKFKLYSNIKQKYEQLKFNCGIIELEQPKTHLDKQQSINKFKYNMTNCETNLTLINQNFQSVNYFITRITKIIKKINNNRMHKLGTANLEYENISQTFQNSLEMILKFINNTKELKIDNAEVIINCKHPMYKVFPFFYWIIIVFLLLLILILSIVIVYLRKKSQKSKDQNIDVEGKDKGGEKS